MKKNTLQLMRAVIANKAWFCLGFAVILLLAFIPSFAQAGVHNSIRDALIELIVFLITVVPASIFFVVAGLTNWMIGIVTSIGIVPGAVGTPPFVELGWQFTRNLVNALFILILVFIGLATILRIQSYQLQRTLPSLLIIALLVNFSGVFVGLIVDMGNLISNFFLSAVGQFSFQTFGNILTTGQTAIKELDFWQSITYAFVMAIFYMVAALIFFVVFLLFFVRTVVLWTLTILAPLAFAAFVLPATKKYWSQWLGQLIQWSIIGIPIGFFLYLSNTVLQLPNDLPGNLSGNLLGSDPVLTGVGASLGSLIASILSPIVGLALLAIGVTLSMQMAPAGAQGIIKFGTKAGVGIGKFAGRRAWKPVRDRLPEGGKKWIERLSTAENPKWGQGKGGLGSMGQRAAAGVAGWGRRAAGQRLKSTVIEGEQQDAAKAKDQAMKQDVIKNLHDLRQTGSPAERTAIMDAMRQKDQIKDALNPDIAGIDNVLKQSEATGVYQKARQTRNMDLVEGLERAFVNEDWAMSAFASTTDNITANAVDPNDQTQGGLDRKDREERGYTSFADKVIGEAKTSDEIKALQKNWWNNDDLMNAAHKFWGGSQTGQAATNFGRDFVNRLGATKKDAAWYFELEKRTGSDGKVMHAPRNVAMPTYLASSAAQGLGIAPLGGVTTTTQANDMTQLANAWAPHFSKVQNQYQELQAILEDQGELEIIRRVPGTRRTQNTLRQRIQTRRTNLRNDITALLAQYPELKTLLARTEESFIRRKVGV